MSDQQQFWMVYGLDRSAPTKRHTSRRLAEIEAERLARIHPGEQFAVLEAVQIVAKREFETTVFRAASEDEPDDTDIF